MNVWIIVDSDRKNFLKRLLGRNEDFPSNVNFDQKFSHETNKDWKFEYLKKNNSEGIKNSLLNKLEDLEKNINKDNKNVIIIFLNNLTKDLIKEFLLIFIKQKFEEHHQPFILFITEKIDNEIQQEKIIGLLEESAKDYINDIYKENEEKKICI